MFYKKRGIPFSRPILKEKASALHQRIFLVNNLTKWLSGASQVALVVKNLPASEGDIRDTGSIPGSGRSPGEGHSNPLQYSYLESPMDREAWQATVHGVVKSWTWLKGLSMHTCAVYGVAQSRTRLKRQQQQQQQADAINPALRESWWCRRRDKC